METAPNLDRFIEAQETDYRRALREIRNGRKQSHWIWYIFPQIEGLGFSETSRFYGISDKEEAEQYLKHPVLGKRLREISAALLDLENTDARLVMGTPDDLKLRSSMTLFSSLPESPPVFEEVLNKFFNSNKDEKTLQILKEKA